MSLGSGGIFKRTGEYIDDSISWNQSLERY